MHYAIVPVEGPIRFEEVEQIDLDHLYAGTGAQTVEVHELSRDGIVASIWMDEEYLGTDKPVNRTGDYLARLYGGGLLIGGDGISGDVVLTGPADDETGETLGLSEEWIAFLRNLPAEARPGAVELA